MIKQILALLGLATGSSSAPYTPSQDLSEVSRPETPFRLVVTTGYGAKALLDHPNPTEEDIISWMNKLDWKNGFHSVALQHDDHNWFDVSGSLNPSDGLSGMVSLGGDQWVTSVAPASVDEMKTLIISYFRNDNEWKNAFD